MSTSPATNRCMTVLQLVAPASGRGRRRPAPGARASAPARRWSRSSRSGCARRTPGRRDRAPGRTPPRAAPSSHGSTKVRIGERSRGGVSISVRSRSPASERCSVRGIGVAVSVSTSTASRSSLSRSLCFTPKRCSSSTTRRPRSLNTTSLESSRWVPMTMSIVAGGQPRERRLLLLGGPEAGEHLDLDRKVGQPLDEGAAVLLGQNRRRHQHGDLLAALHRLERGAHRDLGLAVADVAHQQPVHRARPLHVALDLLGRLPLVGRVLVQEAALELALPLGVGREGVAAGDLAAGVEVEQLGGHLLDRLPGLLAHPLPAACRRAGGAAAAAGRRLRRRRDSARAGRGGRAAR